MAGDESPRDPDAWIERVVKVTAALGMNPTRTRWRLIRWQEQRRRSDRRRAQVLDHIRYEHKTCAVCGHVQDRDATTCTRCDARLGKRSFQVLSRMGFGLPKTISVSTVLALALVAVYARELAAVGGGLGSPSAEALFQLGGRWAPAIADEPWRMVTAVLLHAGLWHVGFNLLAIASIGPRIEELYGRTTMLVLFLATGVVANLGSNAVGPIAVGIGASGGVMGLIGVAAGYGHRHGTSAGRALRDDMVKWTLYTIIFGFAVGADNWAHAFGGLAGAAIGLAVRPAWWGQRRLRPLRIALGVLAVGVLLGAVAIIVTRQVTPTVVDEAALADDSMDDSMDPPAAATTDATVTAPVAAPPPTTAEVTVVAPADAAAPGSP